MSKQTDNYFSLASALGFRYDAVNNVLYGQRDGFDLIVYAADAAHPYLLSAHTAARNVYGATLTKEQTKELVKSVKPISGCLQNGSSIVVTINASMGSRITLEKLTACVAEGVGVFTAFLRQKGFIPCCSMCGMEKYVTPHEVEGAYYHLCPECEMSMRGRLSAPKPLKRENVVGGIVGALLGSLLGVLCIVALGQAGYVAALSGAIMAVGVLKGYELLGGRLTKKGIVISIVIMLAMTYVGNQLDWAISLYRKGGGADLGFNIFDCYKLVPWSVSNGVIDKSSYIFNLCIIYLFLLLGAVPTICTRVKEKQIVGRMVRIGSADQFGGGYMQ